MSESAANLSGNPGPDMGLYQAGSIDPSGHTERTHRPGRIVPIDRTDEFSVSPCYNRGVQEYEAELDPHFRIDDWRGARLLDIGSGKYDRFGRQARKLGVHVISVNPMLKTAEDRTAIAEVRELDYDNACREARRDRPWRRVFGPKVAYPDVFSVAALAQALPFAAKSFDGAVSVYGTPQYLHHIDPTLTDEACIAAYTPEIRARDKALITASFSEILRVLVPGGTAYLKDEHRSPGQTQQINGFSPSDGTEVLEVLDDLRDQGAKTAVYEIERPLAAGSGPFTRLVPGTIGKTERTIILHRPL